MTEGPTPLTLTVLHCTGCRWHVPMDEHHHRCTHEVARNEFGGTVNGVYVGVSDMTPEWCPFLVEGE